MIKWCHISTIIWCVGIEKRLKVFVDHIRARCTFFKEADTNMIITVAEDLGKYLVKNLEVLIFGL